MKLHVPTSGVGRAFCGSAVYRLLFGLSSLGLVGLSVAGPVSVSQSPLYVGGFVPGNLMLVPSVEWPTINSAANIDSFNVSQRYVGYFDPDLCYEYKVNSANRSQEYFDPVAQTSNMTCSAKQWSGNFMNWAATQTIDPFRLALTGGYRVKDEVDETWLEKARQDGQGSFAERSLSLSSGLTPYGWGAIKLRINGLGSRMRFSSSGDLNNPGSISDYVDASNADGSGVYDVHVRVKVCDKEFDTRWRKENCKKYGDNWKPEGLIQQYADSLRFAIFGFLNDSNVLRDGGVLRAKAKFVGPQAIDPQTQNSVDNPAREWNPVTGVFYADPDSANLLSSSVAYKGNHSGVINYLNKFGQMTDRNHKSYDPVSELYYTMVRYLKNQGNVAAYSSLSGTDDEKLKLADGFPVITSWDDPIQYWCQKNVALGIGDVNTHRDKNLPGNVAGVTDEPAIPPEVSADNTVNVDTSTTKVFAMEGVTNKVAADYTGRQNSAYIAGLAYDAHTVDLRPESGVTDPTLLKRIKGKQTLSTYWVDVRENTVLASKNNNQYWLAAKYGGFKVPEGFDPYATTTTSLPDALWYTSGEVLASNYKRADNFFVASDAAKMVESLTKAFARIAAERTSAAAPLTASGNQMVAGATIFQSRFSSTDWSGDLFAYEVDTTTQKPKPMPLWSAAGKLPSPDDRKIYFFESNGTRKEFKSAEISSLSADLVNYLRGDRSKEQPAGAFRTRGSLLGDMVNSSPLYVGKPNAALYKNDTSYRSFASSNANRAAVVYVGGNDGMLHGFNAATGAELFAFVPAAVMSSINTYAQPNYQHRYFVDGEMTAADVKLGGQWKSVLVGSLGRGGKSVFALDVTNPTDVKLLWEIELSSIGQVVAKPIIAQVKSGDWRAVFGNGVNSSADNAKLVMIELANGTATVVDTGGGSGLSGVDVWDTDGDGYHDTAYGGDQDGNIWVFEGLGNANPTKRLLYTARDANNNSQPVTAAPISVVDPKTNNRWVFFGTGRFLGDGDLTSKSVQSWYGVVDKGSQVSGRSVLVQREIKRDALVGERWLRALKPASENDMAGKSGWFMDLKGSGVALEGERMIVPNQMRGTSLIGTTRIPDASDPCLPEGRGFVMAINPFTGAALDGGFFDVNGDGKVDQSDMVDGDYVSGLGTNSSPSSPIFIGNSLLTSLENTAISQVVTLGATGLARRMSWREIIGD